MLVYVNAYLVGRNFGGSEEGGWWYNSGNCVASVPVIVPEEIEKQSRQERNNLCEDPEDFTKEYIDNEVNSFVLDKMRSKERVLDTITWICDVLSELEYGDINSVLGGEEIQTRLEMEFGTFFPKISPHYE